MFWFVKLNMRFYMIFLLCLVHPSIIAMDKRILHGKQVTNFGRFFLESIFRKINYQWFSSPEKEWGFMVSLHSHFSRSGFNYYQEKMHSLHNFCSGSIISPHFVITAAHCVNKFSLKYDTNQWMYQDEANRMIGIIIMSNSKYSQVGKSRSQKIHLVEDIMIHPTFLLASRSLDIVNKYF